MASAKEVVDRSIGAFRARDHEAFAALYSRNAEIVGPGGRAMRGPEGGRELFETRLRHLSDLEMTVDREQVVGSTVLVEGTFTGTHTGSRSTREDETTGTVGARISGHYAEVFEIEGGLIAAHRLYLDDPYAGTPPWEIDGPQPSLAELWERGSITGRVLDVGCGSGENALFLAELGLEVVGLDASRLAIEKARLKAHQRRVNARFVVGDATELSDLGETFDTVLDSGLLHVLSDADSALFVSGLHNMLRPGASYHLMCLSERAAIPGPRHLTRREICEIFSDGWIVESLVETRFEVSGAGGWTSEQAAAWLASIRRTEDGSSSRPRVRRPATHHTHTAPTASSK